jgi:hypothetical protein
VTAVAAISDMAAVCELPFSVPVISADELPGTVTAVAMNVVEAAPAGTVTDEGTDNSPLLLDRATVAPPADAG